MEHQAIETKLNVKQESTCKLPTRFNCAMCRMLDFTVAALGLLMLSPLFIFIAIKIRMDSAGPTFYRGKRMGRYGKPFQILKFRTMYEAPESYKGSKVTASGDPRITPFGQWLRDTKMNELPQLINVLKGEMSLVGPRPEDFEIASGWSDHQKTVILSVRPGMTSPASVMYRDEEQMLNQDNLLHQYLSEILPDKLRMDMLYVNKKNVLFDIDVIFSTLLSLLPYWRKTPIRRWELYYGPLHRFARRYAMWFFIDTFLATFSLGATAAVYRVNAPLDVGWPISLLYAFIFVSCFGASNYAFQLYAIEWSRAPSRLAINLLFSAAAGMLGVNLIEFIFHSSLKPLPVVVSLVATMLTWFLSVAVRYRERLITTVASRWIKARNNANSMAENVLIIGAGRNAYAVQWLFDQSEFHRWFRIAGFIDDEHTLQLLQVGLNKVLGTTENIPEVVEKYNIGLICFTIKNISSDNRQRILNICSQTGVRTVEMPDFFGIMYDAFKPCIKENIEQKQVEQFR
ncbi:MAG: sugar transferase [Anaerolineae bacterium]|nr:sugar transferase [Anaerolineae bacterium]